MNTEQMIERLLRHDGCGVRRVNNYGLGNYSATVLHGGGSGETAEEAVRKAVQSELSIRAGSVIRLLSELKGVKERLEKSSAVCRDIGFGDEVEKAERLISDELNEVEITIKRKPDDQACCSEMADGMREAASGAADPVQALTDLKRAMDEHIAAGKLGVHDPDDTARLCLEKLNDEITGRTHELNRQIEALQLRDQPVPSGLWESKEEVRKLCIKTGRYVSHVRACERAKVV